jgi:hypothetical protein
MGKTPESVCAAIIAGFTVVRLPGMTPTPLGSARHQGGVA